MLVNGYKDDFVDFFRMKVTQEGAAIDPTSEGRGVSQSNSNNAKLPKRHKSNAKDSVESIASNVQALIEFSRDQSQKMRHLKKINNASNKADLNK